MSDETVRTGGCLCGQVRYEARGEPENVRLCHCRNCQLAMGSPFFARALYPSDQVTVTGEMASYASSPRLHRMFCPRCGTSVLARRADGGFVGLALACLDDPDALPPDAHFFTDSKVGWVRINDELPQYGEWAPG